MLDGDIMQYLSPEFIFGFVGGAIITALLTLAITSFVIDKMGKALKKWEKVGCAFVAAFIISLVWGLYNGGIIWSQIPGHTIVYGTISGFVYENLIKPFLKKKD